MPHHPPSLMPRFRRLFSLALLAIIATSGCAGPPQTADQAPAPASEVPAFYEGVLLDDQAITAVRDALRNDQATPAQRDALNVLIALADDALTIPIGTVTNKPEAGPSGDKHDYVSFSPYWWPNPDTADGLPYIRRDGQFNPERDNYDVAPLSDMASAVRWLGFAYYFTGNEEYARNAIERCRVWFVDPQTRMTPRLQYGQFIPGVEEQGRHLGIIETVRLRWFPDSFNMLDRSPHMTDEVRDGVKQWFNDYAQWLMDSEFGTAERTYPNNHGTWANAQTANYATFAGREDIVRQILATLPDRIAAQIEPDGSQPHELERTNALHYSDFNLRAMMDLAALGQNVGVDLWSFETPDGRSLRAAADYLRPFHAGEKPWPYQQINRAKASTCRRPCAPPPRVSGMMSSRPRSPTSRRCPSSPTKATSGSN